MPEKFPSWRYGPDGQATIFFRASEIPSDWADHPSKVGQGISPAPVEPPPAPPPQPPAAALVPREASRKELMGEFSARNLYPPKNTPTKVLQRKLAQIMAFEAAQ